MKTLTEKFYTEGITKKELADLLRQILELPNGSLMCGDPKCKQDCAADRLEAAYQAITDNKLLP